MMRSDTTAGQQGGSDLIAHRNIQQTIAMQMAKFETCFVNELNSAKTVGFQVNGGQAQGFSFQLLHGT